MYYYLYLQFFAFCSLMMVVNSQHENNYQPQQMYSPLLNFPHQDHQPMQNYMQAYLNYPQHSNQMHSQQPQMNYNQQPHMNYQQHQQLSYHQQPSQNYHQQQQPFKSYHQQQQHLKNYNHKPQQQMIQNPYMHVAEQLPQPAALTSEPIHHQQQQHQEQQQQKQQQEEQKQQQEEEQQNQQQEQEKYETQYPQQKEQEEYQITEKSLQKEIVKTAENTKTSIEYDYNYSVHDDNTKDIKQHHEKALNGAIVGQYSLMDADGYRRIVDYTADDKNGFKAVVRREFVEIPKSALIVEKVPSSPKLNAQPQYFSSPAPSSAPIIEVSKPTPAPQQAYKQLISVPIVQQQQFHYSAPASTKHIIQTHNDLHFFAPPPLSVPVAEKFNTQNSMINQQQHQPQAPQQQAHQQHQFFFHPVPAPVLEKYLAPAIQQQQYFSAPTSAPKVSAPVTEYSSYDNNPYTEVSFAGPVSNYHY